MADENSTSQKVAPVYFRTDPAQPSILDVVNALDGVCSTMDANTPNFNDHDELNRMCNLATAARILSGQLVSRWEGGKPPTRRQIEAARKASDDWRKLCETAAGGQA